MEVRLRQCLVAVNGTGSVSRPGSLWECDAAEAARLVAAGFAEYIENPAPPVDDIEQATMPAAAERATKPRGRPRGRRS